MNTLQFFLSSLNFLQLAFFTLVTGIVFIFIELLASLLTNIKLISKFFSSTVSKKWSGKIIGSLFVVALALAANHWTVYVLTVVVIATLVTEMEFLLWVLTLLGNRVEVAKTMMGIQNQENAPVPNDMEDIG